MSTTILITGANGGLGTTVVRKFLDQSYQVLAVDQSSGHLEFAKNNPLFRWQGVDLSQESVVDSFVEETLAKYKKIDGAIFLAGGFTVGGVKETTGATLKKMMTLNFETAYFLARRLFENMMEQGYGRLVFIGARPALKPEQGKTAVAYALTKSLLFRLAEILNAEAKNKNVTASVVVPSTIDTAANRQSMPTADFSAWVKPEEIADVLEFICSEKAKVLREPIYKVYNNA